MSITSSDFGNGFQFYHELKDFNGDGVEDMLTLARLVGAGGQISWGAAFQDGATGQFTVQQNVNVQQGNNGVFTADIKMDLNGNGTPDRYFSQWKIGSSTPPGQTTLDDNFNGNDTDGWMCVPLYSKLKLF